MNSATLPSFWSAYARLDESIKRSARKACRLWAENPFHPSLLTYPTPEGTPNGLLLLMGQISGIAFILGMDSFKSPDTGSMTQPLVVLIGLMVIGLLLCTRLREAKTLTTAGATETLRH